MLDKAPLILTLAKLAESRKLERMGRVTRSACPEAAVIGALVIRSLMDMGLEEALSRNQEQKA